MPWPLPAPLEGVKSRKRVIFEVAQAELAVGDGVSRISRLTLNLFSRIAAIGEAGFAVVELLLGRASLPPTKVKSTQGLGAVHLGPFLAGVGATEEEHATAIVEALQSRAQIIVLDEAAVAGDAAWARVFDAIVGGKMLASFRGAVVICASDETLAVKAFCHERWIAAAGWLWQEEISTDAFEISEDVLGSSAGADASREDLLKAVDELSAECFSGEVVDKARESDWLLSTLTKRQPDGTQDFCGFICHRMEEKSRSLCVYRLAVSAKWRGRGFGQRLMRWLLDKAAQMPESECAWISLSALKDAIPFYERFGFCDLTCLDPDDPETTQIWMEMQNHSLVPDPAQEDSETE
uniref:N-acetyltransferase domain-containing protein n=1 Tax=Alexandrium catenella TaxID=2925 RepID=A0A7S1RQH9_ALECA